VLPPEAERLYRHVLRAPPAEVGEHAGDLGWTVDETERALADLERLRLARRAADGTVRVDDPRASVGRLLDGQEAELDERRRQLLALRGSLESFELDFRHGLQQSGPRVPPWETVAPSDASAAVDHLLRTSDGPLLQVTRRIEAGPGHEEAVRRQFEEVTASGRAVRTIFPSSVLPDPWWLEFARHRARAGEQQRYLPDGELRVEFGVFGSSGVLVEHDDAPEPGYLLLRPPSVIGAFTALFEELWRRAEPVLSQGPSAPAQTVKLLELLALGFKDEAIARQLGLSLRTVRRRLSVLMEEHGADTRFQLGLAVSRRGLLRADRR
jgi:DNA-binding transcriptional ArsR family regulator